MPLVVSFTTNQVCNVCSSPFQPFSGLAPVCSDLSCAWEPRPAYNISYLDSKKKVYIFSENAWPQTFASINKHFFSWNFKISRRIYSVLFHQSCSNKWLCTSHCLWSKTDFIKFRQNNKQQICSIAPCMNITSAYTKGLELVFEGAALEPACHVRQWWLEGTAAAPSVFVGMLLLS